MVIDEIDRLTKGAINESDGVCQVSVNALADVEALANELRAVQDAHEWLQGHCRSYELCWSKSGGWYGEVRPSAWSPITLYTEDVEPDTETAALLNLLEIAQAWHAKSGGGG
jgi:hypothetical protein